MSKSLAIAAVLAALALAGCKSVPPPPQTWKHPGHELVQRKCGGCHAVDMEHYSINSDAPPLRDLFRRYPIVGLDEAFARGLVVGHYDMPRFTLPPDERAQILDYLKSLDPCMQPSPDGAIMQHCFAPTPQDPAKRP